VHQNTIKRKGQVKMLNDFIGIGRLTKDVELRYTQSGTAVASFTLAVDRSRKNANGERETDFIPIVVWQQQAENCNTYLSKGKVAAVSGRLQIRNYEDKDGNRRTIAEVVAESVVFLSPKDSSNYSAQQGGTPHADVMISDDDLPF